MKKLLIAAATTVAVCLVIGVVIFFRVNRQNELPSSSREQDPRLSYAGPFQNIHPRVKYVGDAVCADCHPKIFDRFRKHPMGHSLAPITAAQEKDILGKKHRNPFQALDNLIEVQHKGDQVMHSLTRLDSKGNTIFEHAFPVHYVVGSGQHGKSYISNRDGRLYMTPVSWYAQKGVWDLSPGFSRERLKGRNVLHACLFCHCNKAEPVEETINHFQAPIFRGFSIGCERCHGPGQLHADDPGIFKTVTDSKYGSFVAAMPQEADFTIVNPRRLSPRLRDAVCDQCHLPGKIRILHRGRKLYDFRPGLPLETCSSIYVSASRAVAENKVVNHVEQMGISRCFVKSTGANRLGCISCHDPHGEPAPEKRIDWYRERCYQCHNADAEKNAHKSSACAVPRSQRLQTNKTDSCIDCHMPQFRPDEAAKELSHGAFTDHRIVRFAGRDAGHNEQKHSSTSDLPLVHFHAGPLELDANGQPKNIGLARDLGVALSLFASREKSPPAYLYKTLQLLNLAVKDDPEDWKARVSQAGVLNKLGVKKEALATLEEILDKRPNHENALVEAAVLAQELGKTQLAYDCWQRLVTINPYGSRYNINLAFAFAAQQKWRDALRIAEKAIALEPENGDFRQFRARCLLRLNRINDARDEIDRIKRMFPDAAAQIDRWFAKQTGK